ncbi:MAG TPA: DMT family transporter [Chitinophagaceae bacterium]|nr:DMT family transporter [Chitinophagaceae bacterium]
MKANNKMWLVFAIVAGLCWGVWGVLAKLIAEDVSPYLNHVLFTIGMLFTVPFVLKKCRVKKLNKKGLMWGIIAGSFALIGNLGVYYAFSSGGEASIVIPLTNLYPIVTILIAILLLKERLNLYNVLGLLLALPAIILLSGYSLLFTNPGEFFSTVQLKSWLWFSLVAFACWGIFSAAQKITTNHVEAEWAYAIFILTSVVIAVGFLLSGKAGSVLSTRSTVIGSIAGMLNGLGVLASFAAYRAEGKASAVTTVAGALQPVFTIILAITFLNENFTALEGTGIGLAITGALLLSYETPKQPQVTL